MNISDQPERWLPYDFHGRIYEISDRGRVRSNGRLRTLTTRPDGYMAITLEVAREHRKTVLVHALVAELFIGPRPERNVVRHLDGSRSFNWVGNLAYGTHQENSDDARLHGRFQFGEGVHSAKLTESAVAALRQLADKLPNSVLRSWLGVSRDVIEQAQRGSTWPHVTAQMSTDDALAVIFGRDRLGKDAYDTAAAHYATYTANDSTPNKQREA